jgi:hypothetical protein
MKSIYPTFLKFCIWMQQMEYDIGAATGMNHRYLAALRASIKDFERDLRVSELNHG